MSILTFLSSISVTKIQQIGSDEMLAHAARVSTKGKLMEGITKESVGGLIRFLMRNRHGSPFEHGMLTVLVHAPIMVFREWHRHRVGWSYNEESGRYKELEPVFYIPPPERPTIRPVEFKSSNPVFEPIPIEMYEQVVKEMELGYEGSYARYQHLLDLGVDRGLARSVLGVGIYSSCYCTANPRSIMHFLELRTSQPNASRPSKPLYEIQAAADQLEAIFKEHWPETWQAWNEHGRIAP